MRTALLALLIVSALASPSVADNDCSLENDLLATPTIPLGCPAVVYHNLDSGYSFNPIAEARRAAVPDPFDVTGPVVDYLGSVPVWVHAIDRSTCVETAGQRDLPRWKWTIDLVGVEVGDTIEIGGKACLQATIVAAGACTETLPELTWEYPPEWFEACAQQDPEDDGGSDDGGTDGGCQVGGDASALLVLVVFGLRRRTRSALRRARNRSVDVPR